MHVPGFYILKCIFIKYIGVIRYYIQFLFCIVAQQKHTYEEYFVFVLMFLEMGTRCNHLHLITLTWCTG